MTAADDAVVVNGRFRHAEPGGFRRYAAEVVQRLRPVEVVEPPPLVARGPRGRLWEHTVLAARADGRKLFSPIGSGPASHGDHVVVIHDLVALEHPLLVSPGYAQIQRRVLPALARRARHVVVPSRSVADAVVTELALPASKVTIAAPGVSACFLAGRDPEQEVLVRRRLGIPPNAQVVLGMNSSIPRKNGGHLLAVLAEVKRRCPGAAVVVTGHDGPARVFGRSARPEHPDVLDVGPVHDHVLADLYRLASVFVWLPLAEGYGLPVLEAGACGVPVVTTPIPAAAEHPGPVCTVVPPDDVGRAARRVTDLLASRAAGDRSHRLDPSSFPSWDATARTVAQVLGLPPTTPATPSATTTTEREERTTCPS